MRIARTATRQESNLGRIKHHWRETRRHLRIESNLNTGLNLIFRLDQRIKKLICVDDRFAIIRHQADKGRVPLVHDLGEGRRAGAHENLTNAVVELLDPWPRS